MTLKTSLGHARGLGSARGGVVHFWAQRVTAVALVPLALWFVVSLIGLTGADYETARAFFAAPLSALIVLLVIGAGTFHMKLGLQVVIEDYVHSEGTKFALRMLNTFFCIMVGLTGAFAALKLALTT
jgi:succinate dehydrogenase / fumarate reductase membrane anchor subunit